MPKKFKEEDSEIAQPIQAILEELEGIKKRLEELEEEKRKESDDEDEEELKEKIRREAKGRVRIYREVDVSASGRNPVETPELGENPPYNAPGEGKYVEKTRYDEDMKRLDERVTKCEEAIGLVRQPDIAGTEEPFDMMKERLKESLSSRKTIIGTSPRETVNKEVIANAVKEFLKTEGVA